MLTDDHDAEIVDSRPAGSNRSVVAENLVAVKLDELVENEIEIIERLRTLRMSRDLGRLPRGEI